MGAAEFLAVGEASENCILTYPRVLKENLSWLWALCRVGLDFCVRRSPPFESTCCNGGPVNDRIFSSVCLSRCRLRWRRCAVCFSATVRNCTLAFVTLSQLHTPTFFFFFSCVFWSQLIRLRLHTSYQQGKCVCVCVCVCVRACVRACVCVCVCVWEKEREREREREVGGDVGSCGVGSDGDGRGLLLN